MIDGLPLLPRSRFFLTDLGWGSQSFVEVFAQSLVAHHPFQDADVIPYSVFPHSAIKVRSISDFLSRDLCLRILLLGL